MERTRFVDHAGRRIVLMDFSNIWRVDEAAKVIEQARQFVAAQPKGKNLLTVVNVAESSFDDHVVEKLKELARHDEPWVLAAAVVGLRGMQKIIFSVVNTFSRRNMATFETVEQAMAWLVTQQQPAQPQAERR